MLGDGFVEPALNWGNDYFALTEGAPPLTPGHEAEIADRAERMVSFLEDFVRVRREADHGDVVSILIRATGDDGEPTLGDDEILGVVNSFFVAGVETTQNFLPLLAREQLRHPDQWAAAPRPFEAPSLPQRESRTHRPAASTSRDPRADTGTPKALGRSLPSPSV